MTKDIHIRLLKKEDAGPLHDMIDRNRKRLERYFPITVSENGTLTASTHDGTKEIGTLVDANFLKEMA